MNSVDIERENIEAMQSYKIIEEEHGHNDETWIIHMGRKHLNQIQAEHAFKGPLNSIESAVKVCEPGSRLIVHSGTYLIEKEISFDKDIQVIGLGRDVTICLEDSCFEPAMFKIISGSTHFENIAFGSEIPVGGLSDAIIFVENHSSLTVNRCKFVTAYRPVSALEISDGEVKVTNCQFIGTKSAGNAISIDYNVSFDTGTARSSLRVQNSKFKNFGTGRSQNPAIVRIHRMYIDEIRTDGTVENHPKLNFVDNILIGCSANTKIVLISIKEIGRYSGDFTKEVIENAVSRMDFSNYSVQGVHGNINQGKAKGVYVCGNIEEYEEEWKM